MTRKDYVALAGAINAARESLDCDQSYTDAITLTAQHIAGVCKAGNARFDYDRFMKACGLAP